MDKTETDRRKRIVAVRFLPGLLILVVGFFGVSAFCGELPAGQPPVPATVEPAPGLIATDNNFIDRSRDYLDMEMYEAVTWFDDLFIDNTASGGTPGRDNVLRGEAPRDKAKRDKEKAEIKLEWSNELRAGRKDGVKYQSSLHVHVHLPQLEKRARLVIMEESRRDVVTPIPSEPGTPVANAPTQANAFRALHTELRFYAQDTKAGYAFLSVGSRFVWLPETFVRGRFLWRRPLGDNTFISPSATPFWQDHLGFGVTPQLDFGHLFAHKYIFLWANSGTKFRNRPGFLWGSEISLARVLSPVSAISFSIGASGSTNPNLVADRYKMGMNNYRALVKYRRNIYRPWIFMEVTPETSWRRNTTEGRDIIPAITVRLEINTEGPRALVPVPKLIKDHTPLLIP